MPDFRHHGEHHEHDDLARKVIERLSRLEQSLDNRDQNLLNAFTLIGESLRRMEHTLSTQGTNLSRLNADMQTLDTKLTNLKQVVVDEAQEIKDQIQAMRDANDNGDDAAFGTAADKAEASITKVEELATSVAGMTTLSVTVTPTSTIVAAGGTAKFKANVPVNWTATSGTVDADGNYTAPSDGTATASVTGTSKSNPSQSASASVQINAPAQPQP